MEDLKLILVRHNRETPAAEMLPAPIPYCELTVVLKGSLEYFVDGKSVTVSAGDIIYIPEGSLRARSGAEEAGDYVSFNFRSDKAWNLPVLMSDCLINEIRLQIALCDALIQKYYPDHEDKITPLLLCMLLSLESHLKEQSLNPIVSSIVRYLHENLSKRITLADIGRHTFFSPAYCDTVFKKEMGRSIIDYLLEQRIEEGKSLLIERGIPLSQIAEAVGFPDYNYFARTFKKRTGYTPMQYRNMLGDQARAEIRSRRFFAK